MSLLLQDWLVWGTPLIAAPLIPLIGKINSAARTYLSLLVSITTSVLSISLLAAPLPRQGSIAWLDAYGLNIDVRVDGLSVFLALIVNLLGTLIVLYSLGYMKGDKSLDRYFSLILLFIGSMTGLVMAGNFLQLYIFWELVGVCSSFLIAFWYDQPQAVHAGLKAFLVTRVGDIGLLAGLVLVYVNTRTFNFAVLEQTAQAGLIPLSVLTTAGLFVFTGAIGKSAQFPLHVWLPDAMEGPTTVSALIHAATMVNAGVYLVARTYPIFSSSSTWVTTVQTVGIITALAAAPLAIAAVDIKRVLAYSTVSQLGLMFAAIGLPASQAVYSSQFHLLSQGAFKALAFLAAGSVIHALETRDMNQMGGLRKQMPITFIGFAAATLAMAGIPPFIGFWSKDLILTAAYNVGSQLLFVLILLVSVMTSFYSFRALFRVFFTEPKAGNQPRNVHESPLVMTLPLLILSGAVLLLFLTQSWAANMLRANLESLSPQVVLYSLTAVILGLIPAYIIYLRKGSTGLFQVHNSGVLALQSVLAKGYGFDSFYDFLIVRPAHYAATKIRGLQTGALGVNLLAVLIFLATFLVVLLAWST